MSPPDTARTLLEEALAAIEKFIPGVHVAEKIRTFLTSPTGEEGRTQDERWADLRTLKENWDSYGGAPIAESAIAAAQEWLRGVSIVPTSKGGVQLEWHRQGYDVELAFAPNGILESVFAEDSAHEPDKCTCSGFLHDPDCPERGSSSQSPGEGVRDE